MLTPRTHLRTERTRGILKTIETLAHTGRMTFPRVERVTSEGRPLTVSVDIIGEFDTTDRLVGATERSRKKAAPAACERARMFRTRRARRA